MSISVACTCSKKLRVRNELAGKAIRCPACGTTLRVRVPELAEPRKVRFLPEASPGFPALGSWLGWAAVLVGFLLIAGGILTTATVFILDGDFKPAGLIVFVLPGMLWSLFGGLLLRLRQRFVNPFWCFLLFNLMLGCFFTTQASGRDAQIFAMIGLGFIFGSMFFQLFHGFLMRDLRRQAATAKKVTP